MRTNQVYIRIMTDISCEHCGNQRLQSMVIISMCTIGRDYDTPFQVMDRIIQENRLCKASSASPDRAT